MNKVLITLLSAICLFALGSHPLKAQSCGTDWEIVNPKENASTPLNGIVYAQNKFVAVGDKGAVMTSPDGLEWTKENNLSSDHYWADIFWNGQQFIAISKNADMMTSLDGINWKVTEANKSFPVNRVATNGDLFVSIATDSAFSRVNSTSQGYVANSMDATNWDLTIFKNIQLTDVEWTGHQFIITGNTLDSRNSNIKGIILTSSDGVNWAQQILYDMRRLITVASNGKEILLYGINDHGQNILLRSNDGQKWEKTQHRESVSVWNSRLLWTGKEFILLHDAGSFETSLDGKQWIPNRLRTNMKIQGLVSNGLNTVVIGNQTAGSPTIMTLKADTTEWTSPLTIGNHIVDITSSDELFVAVLGYNIFTSTDGINWVKSMGSVEYWNGSKLTLWANSQFYIFGIEDVWTSADGKRWEKHDITMEGGLHIDHVVWNGTNFLAIKQLPEGIKALTSVDGGSVDRKSCRYRYKGL